MVPMRVCVVVLFGGVDLKPPMFDGVRRADFVRYAGADFVLSDFVLSRFLWRAC